MTWLFVIGLALVAFLIAAFVFRLSKTLWTSLGAALGFGLAGYALQASPEIPSAPKSAEVEEAALEYDIVSARREFVSLSDQSPNNMLVTSDAYARQGRFVEASQMLAGEAGSNPQDFEVWLAQGIALTEHAGGSLTPAALYAYQQAATLKPGNMAPGYFLGVSLIQQGRLMEARQIWRETLESAPEDAEGRAGLIERLTRLDGMLGGMNAGQPEAPQEGTSESATE